MGCGASKTTQKTPEPNADTPEDLTESEKDLESKLMSDDGKRGTKMSQNSRPQKVVPVRARSQMMSAGNGVSPIKPIRTRSEAAGGVGRTISLIGRPGMAAHMSRKKLVKALLLMYYKNACAENNDKSSKLDHVTFRSMYREITLLGERRQPSASMIRHLMMFLDKKHDPSQIMEFEVVGSVMRAVEVVLSGEDDDASTPDLLMHVAQCLVNRAELMAVVLHTLFMEYADPSQSPPSINAGGLYKLLKGVFKSMQKKKDKPTRDETKIFMTFMDQDGDGVVNEKEFVSYMCVGMCMTLKRRKKFKKKSPMHKKLVKFLTAVGTNLESDFEKAEAARKGMDPEILTMILSYGAG
jgi:hypothetical protein